MKVLLFNGSSRPTGCTFSGNGAFRDCIACGFCAQNNRCVFNDDVVNEWTQKAEKADGFVFGSPVYYAHPSGRILSLMDRMFYSRGSIFAGKPGAVVVSARRAGTTASLDVLAKHRQWFTAIRRMKYAATPKDCKPCATSDGTWRGF